MATIGLNHIQVPVVINITERYASSEKGLNRNGVRPEIGIVDILGREHYSLAE